MAYDPEAMDNVRGLIGDVITYAASAAEALEGADALVVVTEWQEFAVIQPEAMAETLCDKTVFDGRNIYDPAEMKRSGLTYLSIGRP